MMMGLGVVPKRYDPLVDQIDIRQLHGHFAGLRDMIAKTVAHMPTHSDYIARNVAAPI